MESGGKASFIIALAPWPVGAGLGALVSHRTPEKGVHTHVHMSHLLVPGIQEGLVDPHPDLIHCFTDGGRSGSWSLGREKQEAGHHISLLKSPLLRLPSQPSPHLSNECR